MSLNGWICVESFWDCTAVDSEAVVVVWGFVVDSTLGDIFCLFLAIEAMVGVDSWFTGGPRKGNWNCEQTNLQWAQSNWNHKKLVLTFLKEKLWNDTVSKTNEYIVHFNITAWKKPRSGMINES